MQECQQKLRYLEEQNEIWQSAVQDLQSTVQDLQSTVQSLQQNLQQQINDLNGRIRPIIVVNDNGLSCLADNVVTSDSIADNAVIPRTIETGAVTEAKIPNESLHERHFCPDLRPGRMKLLGKGRTLPGWLRDFNGHGTFELHDVPPDRNGNDGPGVKNFRAYNFDLVFTQFYVKQNWNFDSTPHNFTFSLTFGFHENDLKDRHFHGNIVVHKDGVINKSIQKGYTLLYTQCRVEATFHDAVPFLVQVYGCLV